MPWLRPIAAVGLIAVGSLPVPSTAAPPRPDWLGTVVATAEGGFRQGNPKAKVRLLEFGALTCPHCAAFARDDLPKLRAAYVATGRVSYEYRPFLLNGVDFAPALLVLCQPPAAALHLADAFYADQAMWIVPFTKPLPEAAQKQIAALPQNRQITAFAAFGGLDRFVRTRGITRARFDACTSDAANIARLNAIRKDADDNYGLTSVPTFAINGKTVPNTSTWGQLKPVLDAAL